MICAFAGNSERSIFENVGFPTLHTTGLEIDTSKFCLVGIIDFRKTRRMGEFIFFLTSFVSFLMESGGGGGIWFCFMFLHMIRSSSHMIYVGMSFCVRYEIKFNYVRLLG